jgi:hypothetical protein
MGPVSIIHCLNARRLGAISARLEKTETPQLFLEKYQCMVGLWLRKDYKISRLELGSSRDIVTINVFMKVSQSGRNLMHVYSKGF